MHSKGAIPCVLVTLIGKRGEYDPMRSTPASLRATVPFSVTNTRSAGVNLENQTLVT